MAPVPSKELHIEYVDFVLIYFSVFVLVPIQGVPIQVDGEAWVQPPGIIRIIHKNRAQMLCRNRSLEMSLKSWHEKQRQHSISISREHTSNMSDSTTTAGATSAASLPSGLMSERESYLLLNFIECASSLVSIIINKFLATFQSNKCYFPTLSLGYR